MINYKQRPNLKYFANAFHPTIRRGDNMPEYKQTMQQSLSNVLKK